MLEDQPACLVQSRMFMPIRSMSWIANSPPCMQIFRARSRTLSKDLLNSISTKAGSKTSQFVTMMDERSPKSQCRY